MNAERILQEICTRWDLGVSRNRGVSVPGFLELESTIGHAKQLLSGEWDYLKARQRGRKSTDLSGVDWTKSNRQIASETGLSLCTIYKRRPQGTKTAAVHGNRKLIDWSAIDWKKTDRALACELGLSYATVHKKRASLGLQKATKLSSLVDWASLDWTKNNSVLAAEIGASINNVLKYREKTGHKNPFTTVSARPHRTVTKEMIEAANWLEDRDVDICQKWGVSRERVRQIRIENRKPECSYQGRHNLPLLKAIVAHREELTGQNLVAITAKLTPEIGVIKKPSLISALKFLGVEYKSKKDRNQNSI
jgi:hypothetical protein